MRLFVALDFPDSLKDQLLDLQTAIPTARWSTREQMHLTLFFIGETEREDEIKSALAAIQAPAFRVRILGTGRFPHRNQQAPRVLWAGLEAPAALYDLHKSVTTALVKLGCEADSRPYSPHITLARLKAERPLPALDSFLATHAKLQTEPIPMTEFVLYSSTLTAQGAQYQREAAFALD